MKKNIITLLGAATLLTWGIAHGAPIDRNRAATIAATMMPEATPLSQIGGNSPELMYEAKDREGETTAYMFRQPSTSSYVIVAGDDCAENMVLGYGTGAEGESSTMPPAMKWWLDNYGNMAWASTEGRSRSKALFKGESGGEAKEVAPLLGDIAWGQTYPYNSKCPEKGGERCVTGCVATAMAQMMKYWEFPAQGKGAWSYDWDGTTLSADFSTHRYDWKEMKPTYSMGATQEEIDEVARLMLDTGIATSMTYGTVSSGTYPMATVYALINNFGYDKGIRYCERAFYGIDLWRKLLRDELDAGRPVIYIGQSDKEGHEFVCDGYDAEGYFHFNWGWNGGYDGYFLVTALNPNQEHESMAEGYNYNQAIITGIEPDRGRSQTAGATVYGSRFEAESATSYSLVASAYTFYPGEVKIDLGYAVCDSMDVEMRPERVHRIHSASINPVIPARASGMTNSTTIYNSTAEFDPVGEFSLEDGRYYITPVSKTADRDEWEILPRGLEQWVALDVADGKGSIAEREPRSIVITSIEMAPEAVSGREVTLKCSLRAMNGEIYDPVNFTVESADGKVEATSESLYIDISDGETADLELTADLPAGMSPGEYVVRLHVAGTDIGDPLKLHVDEATSGIDGTKTLNAEVSVTGSGISITGDFVTAAVYDLAGRTVYSGSDKTVTLAVAGIYIVKVDDEEPIKVAVR